MILQLLSESIDNKKLEKEYLNNYSDLTEDEFLTMVEMDPSSYPKTADGFDTNADPVAVGNLASGGKGGLLIRCFRNGEKDFLNNFKEVQDACAKYLKNRGKYSIRNAGQFPSVKTFIDYVKSDGNMEIDLGDNVQQKKAQTPEEKLEVLRQKQFPKIENVQKLIEIANLDPESDVEHGQIGNLARGLLLPHYNNGDTKFLNKKNSIKKAILAFSNASDAELAEKPLSKYLEKEGNDYKYKIVDFILDWYSAAVGNTNFSQLLSHYADEGKEYEWVCETANYQVVKFWTKHVGYIVDYCDIPIEVFQKKFGDVKDAPDKWAKWVGSSYEKVNYKEYMVTNTWCTGWAPGETAEEHLRNYFNTNKNSLFVFIKKERLPYNQENKANYLVSIYNNGQLNDIADGTDIQGITNTHIKNFQNMLRANSDILPYLLRYDAAKNNNYIMTVVKELGIDPNATKTDFERVGDVSEWENKIEEEDAPFVYSSPLDIDNYKEKTKDNVLNGIEELVIAEGVTEIPDFIFQGCSNLRKITFPKSLIKIGNKSFSNCKSLLNIKLPENLKEIGLGAFEGCDSLRGSVRLPISIEKIDQNAFAFHNKKGLKFVISPKRLDPDNNTPLLLPVEDHDFWFAPGRIKFSDN